MFLSYGQDRVSNGSRCSNGSRGSKGSRGSTPSYPWKKKKEGELLDGDVGKERLNEGAGMRDFLL